MAKITKDDFELDDLSESAKAEAKKAATNAGAASAAPGEQKMDASAAVGGGIMDIFTLGHTDALIRGLKNIGLGTADAPKQTSEELFKEHPWAANAGRGLAMALPVAGAEAFLGNAARGGTGLLSQAASKVVPKAFGGEGALGAAARAAGAELGVGEALQAGRAATGADADWTAPLYSAALAGPLSAFGGRFGGKARGPEAEIRKAVPGVPEDAALAATRADPSKTIADVAQTAPEALKEAGLGKQAGDAEALLRRTLGGEAPVVPGRNAALDAGADIRSAATSRMPPGAPAYNAMDKQNLFEMFRSGLDEGVTPTPAREAGGLADKAAGFVGRLGFNATVGKIPILGDIASAFGGDEVAGRLVQAGLNKIMGSTGMPKNAAAIQEILMDPAKFSGILKPEEMAALTKYAALRGAAASTAGEMGPGQGGGEMDRIRARFPKL